MPGFYVIFVRKMPEYYIIARKIFFPIFLCVGGGHVPSLPLPPSLTPAFPSAILEVSKVSDHFCIVCTVYSKVL